MNGNKQSCVWEVNVKKDNPLQPNAYMSQAFTLDQSGSYMLLCHSQNSGGNIYKVIINYMYIIYLFFFVFTSDKSLLFVFPCVHIRNIFIYSVCLHIPLDNSTFCSI